MNWRDDLFEESGYTICPISFPQYQHCNEKCEECKTYIEYKNELERIVKYEQNI